MGELASFKFVYDLSLFKYFKYIIISPPDTLAVMSAPS